MVFSHPARRRTRAGRGGEDIGGIAALEREVVDGEHRCGPRSVDETGGKPPPSRPASHVRGRCRRRGRGRGRPRAPRAAAPRPAKRRPLSGHSGAVRADIRVAAACIEMRRVDRPAGRAWQRCRGDGRGPPNRSANRSPWASCEGAQHGGIARVPGWRFARRPLPAPVAGRRSRHPDPRSSPAGRFPRRRTERGSISCPGDRSSAA